MYNRIFVALDLDHPERMIRLVETARQVGGDNAHYILATVLPFTSSSMVSNFLPKDYRRRVKDEIHARLDAFAAGFSWRDNLKTEVYSGSIYEEISDNANAENCDLLVIGAGRIGRGGLGGNAQRSAQFFRQTVLIVR